MNTDLAWVRNCYLATRWACSTRTWQDSCRAFSRYERYVPQEKALLAGWRVSWKSLKLFRPEKPFVKLQPIYSVKLVFSYVVRGKKLKQLQSFVPRDNFVLQIEREFVTRKAPETFRDFWETGSSGLFLESPENISSPKGQLSNCTPLVLKSWTFNAFNRIAKFHGLEPRRWEDI